MTTIAAVQATPEDIQWFLESVPGATKEELQRWERKGLIKFVDGRLE
jgi:hypothetical protein